MADRNLSPQQERAAASGWMPAPGDDYLQARSAQRQKNERTQKHYFTDEGFEMELLRISRDLVARGLPTHDPEWRNIRVGTTVNPTGERR